VQSLGHPGGNATGLSIIGPQLAGKRLELLKEAYPPLTSVATMWNPAGATSMAGGNDDTKCAAGGLGIQCRSLQVRTDAEILGAFKAAEDGHVNGLVIIYSALFTASRKEMIDLAASTHLPAICGERDFAAAGGLMAYGPNIGDLWRST